MAAQYFDCDTLWVNMSLWPNTREAQEEVLRRLRKWDYEPNLEHLLNRGSYRQIAEFELDAGYGIRWFHVWEPPDNTSFPELCVIKELPTSDEVIVQWVIY